MDNVVETLKLIAEIVIKQEHEVLDKEMSIDEKVDFVNSVRALDEHCRHIEKLVA